MPDTRGFSLEDFANPAPVPDAPGVPAAQRADQRGFSMEDFKTAAPGDSLRGAVGLFPEVTVKPPSFKDSLALVGQSFQNDPGGTLGAIGEQLTQDIISGIASAGRLAPDLLTHFNNIQMAAGYADQLKQHPLDTEASNALKALRTQQELDNKQFRKDAKEAALLAAGFAPFFSPLKVGATTAKLVRAGSLAERLIVAREAGNLGGAAIRLADRAAAGALTGGTYGYFQSDGDWEAAKQSAEATALLFAAGPAIGKTVGKTTGAALGLAGKAAAGTAKAALRGTAALPGVSPAARTRLQEAATGTLGDRLFSTLPDLLRRYDMADLADEFELMRTESSILAGRAGQGYIKELRRKEGTLGARKRVYSDDDYEAIVNAIESASEGGLDRLPTRLQQVAFAVRDDLLLAGDIRRAFGTPTFKETIDPTTGKKVRSFYNFVLRNNFFPHIVPDPQRFSVGGPLRKTALARMQKSLGVTRQVAEKKLDEWIARMEREIPIEATSGFPSRATGYARSLDLPGYSLDLPDVLELYHSDTARIVSAHRRFGRTRTLVASPPGPEPTPSVQAELPLEEPAEPIGQLNLPLEMTASKKAPVSLAPVRTSTRRDSLYPAVRTILARAVTPEAIESVTEQIFKAADTGALDKLLVMNPALGSVGDDLRAVFGQVMFKQGLPITKRSSLGFLDYSGGIPEGYPLSNPLNGDPETLFPEVFSRIAASPADAGRKELMVKLARDALGYSPEMSALERGLVNVTGAVTRIEAVTKLGLSAISQLSQFLTPVVRTQFRGAAGNFWKTLRNDPEAMLFAAESGSILANVVRDAENAIVGAVGSDDFLRYVGFTQADMRARAFAALQGAAHADYVSQKLWELYRRSPDKPLAGLAKLERKLLSIGIDPRDVVAQRGHLTRDQRLLAANTVAYDANFWSDAISLPEFFRSPAGKVIAQFKSFGYQQTRFVKKHVVDPWVKHGDMGPALRFALLIPLGGEVIADIKAFLAGRSRTDDSAKRLLENLAYAGGFGLMSDVMMSAERGVIGLSSIVTGPGISHGIDIGSALYEASKGNVAPAVRQATRLSPLLFRDPRLQALAAVARPAVETAVAGGQKAR